jgi:uncharacterized membrane protein YbhN (UPF0104 family)
MDQPIHDRALERTVDRTLDPTGDQITFTTAPVSGMMLRFGARRLILLALLAAATIALLFALGGGTSTLMILAQANWTLLALAALIHYGGFALRGHRWQLLLGALGYRLSYLYTTGLLLAGWFVSALLPARAGDAFRVVALRMPPANQPSVPVAPAIGAIVLERTLDILAILLLSAGSSVAVLQGRIPAWLLWTYGAALAMLLIVAGVLLATPLLLERLRPLSPPPLWGKSLDFITQIAVTLRQLAEHPTIALITIGESLLIWLCDGVLLWLVILSLGNVMSLGAANFVAQTVDIFSAVPLTPGGMGQIESAYAALLALLAQNGLHIAAIILATRAISYWSFLIFSGVVTLLAGFGRVFNQSAS